MKKSDNFADKHRLQEKQPQDYVIATGVQYSVRQFVILSAKELGVTIEFRGEGMNETAVVTEIEGDNAPALNVGDEIVAVDPHYFRPTEVETLLGDSTKAKHDLGWVPEITLKQMVKEMVEYDLDQAKRHSLLRTHGYNTSITVE